MSRIGKMPVKIVSGVTVNIEDGKFKTSGPKGNLEFIIPPFADVTIEGEEVIVNRKNDEKVAKSQHGLTRALVFNAVTGVSTGFEIGLEIVGVGFKVALEGDTLNLALGFSHPVKYKLPAGISAEVDKLNIKIKGIDKQLVGQVAAEIRSLKKPEPYKGKGIRYTGENILRKAGKAGK
jgi:large subunit ribosomal protein L6